jgi:hypothetical protein
LTGTSPKGATSDMLSLTHTMYLRRDATIGIVNYVCIDRRQTILKSTIIRK